MDRFQHDDIFLKPVLVQPHNPFIDIPLPLHQMGGGKGTSFIYNHANAHDIILITVQVIDEFLYDPPVFQVFHVPLAVLHDGPLIQRFYRPYDVPVI